MSNTTPFYTTVILIPLLWKWLFKLLSVEEIRECTLSCYINDRASQPSFIWYFTFNGRPIIISYWMTASVSSRVNLFSRVYSMFWILSSFVGWLLVFHLGSIYSFEFIPWLLFYDVGFLLRMGVCYNASSSVNINLDLIPLLIMFVLLLCQEST